MPNGGKAGSPKRRRTAADSICNKEDPDRYFHLYAVDGVSVWSEITGTIHGDDRLPVLEQIMRVEEIRTQIRAAAAGRLRGAPELKPAWTPPSPELWELVFVIGRKKTGSEYRMYHAEREGLDPSLVGLLFHQKDTSGDADQIDQRQEDKMREAGGRFVRAAAVSWGHVAGPCPNCERT